MEGLVSSNCLRNKNEDFQQIEFYFTSKRNDQMIWEMLTLTDFEYGWNDKSKFS